MILTRLLLSVLLFFQFLLVVDAFVIIDNNVVLTRPFSKTTKQQSITDATATTQKKNNCKFHRFVLFNSRKEEEESSSTTATSTTFIEDEIRSMRVKQLKDELEKYNISTKDVFEKEELIQRLLNARQKQPSNTNNGQQQQQQQTMNNNNNDDNNDGIIKSPLYFTSLTAGTKVAAVNLGQGGGIKINPGDQPYATIVMHVINDASSSSSSSSSFSLRLLLDTACSGFVIRPSIVEKYNLPKLSTPVTMTGAGGTTSGTTGLTQFNKFYLDESTGTTGAKEKKVLFGPLPAAVQDIGALPMTLDGIVGLSFLSQFDAVDMDFAAGQLSLYPLNSGIDKKNDDDVVNQLPVSCGDMTVIPHLGIYTVDVYFGTRGPVKMLVDTGASNTYLNWKGVSSLGIPSLNNDDNDNSKTSSSLLKPLSNPMGAMGSDNIAMKLTHCIHVSSYIQLGSSNPQTKTSSSSSLPGLSLKDDPSKRLRIDIGNIAILDSMSNQNVGGILGVDALMRCSRVRMNFNGNAPRKELRLYE